MSDGSCPTPPLGLGTPGKDLQGCAVTVPVVGDGQLSIRGQSAAVSKWLRDGREGGKGKKRNTFMSLCRRGSKREDRRVAKHEQHTIRGPMNTGSPPVNAQEGHIRSEGCLGLGVGLRGG